MILAGILFVLGAGILWYMIASYILWKHTVLQKEHHVSHIIEKRTAHFLFFQKKLLHILITFFGRGISWIGNVSEKLFLFVFPSAKKALEKHDPLVGIKHGPASFYLASISQSKEPAEKMTKARKKKISSV
jgi:hypothetical protein